MEVDTQGLTAEEFEDILCHSCGNAPLSYYCPACEFQVCSDCLRRHFHRHINGALECKACGHVDKVLSTWVGKGKI
jgi:hypothetical protein